MRKHQPFRPYQTESAEIGAVNVEAASERARREGKALLATVSGIDFLVRVYPWQHVTLTPYINDEGWRYE